MLHRSSVRGTIASLIGVGVFGIGIVAFGVREVVGSAAAAFRVLPAVEGSLQYNDGRYLCPGSSASDGFGTASNNAWTRVEVLFNHSCDHVDREMMARVRENAGGTWMDPHNHGAYSLVRAGEFDDPKSIAFTRHTGDGLFTDALTFMMYDIGEHDGDSGSRSGFLAVKGVQQCRVYGCSESQGGARADFSTNYCNMRMLYCSAADGCTPFQFDNPAQEEISVSHAMMATVDMAQCFYGNNLGKYQYCMIASPADYAVPEKRACMDALAGKPTPGS